MITVIVNDTAHIVTKDSAQEENAAFIQICKVLKEVADEINNNGDPTTSARIHRTIHTVTLRTIAGAPYDHKETKIIISIVSGDDFVAKEWGWFDREVENSQGGTTQFTGWELI